MTDPTPFRAATRHRRRRASRGVATVEAVVALPVLVLLFIAVFFFRDLAGARHEAATKARSCAWLYSANNCTTVPAGCEGVLTDTTAVGDASDVSLPLPASSVLLPRPASTELLPLPTSM